ncbi:ATP-binding protein [Ekhidna sp. MALMAid0563]|uniref:ATP-binding protein n=1 Tax=Ekhidna sp. MALMAid0563 TaxID=3143937 RepID=UPI0032DFF356
MHRHLISLLTFYCLSLSLLASPLKHDAYDTLDLYWFTSRPFVYENEAGEMEGIEPDMLRSFQRYLEKEENISVTLNWVKANDFSHILEIIKGTDDPDAIGVSALSITDERKEYASFVDPYLPDITVLISSKGTPIVRSFEELYEMMRSMDAVTIRDTKYEMLLNNLRKQIGLNFDIIYIESEQNVIEGVASRTDCFGFIDLPVYLLQVESGGEVVRQNFFTVKGQGYSYMMPVNNNWKDHFNRFLVHVDYRDEISDIISGYLGEELYGFIDDLYRGEALGTSILTKEKEMQLELLKNVNFRLEQEQTVRKILIVSTSIAVLFLVAIGYLYYRNQKATNLLLGQKGQIEVQQQDIQQKNEQLMNRNAQLVALNEEKNNLVRILAHDIRSPLSQIIMVTDILNQKIDDNLPETDVKLLNQVTASAERINKMVTKILDVDGLEENRVKVMNERVDIRDVMKDVAQRYRPIAAKKNIDLSVEFCDDHYMIRTDHLLLLLVLENLVSNAVKFSDQDNSVELRAQCEYDSVLFKVSDKGPGFSENDKKKLFNRFQKLTAKPTAGETSTGLGLSIVKKYVQDLGGKVWVESEFGKGSTFFVKLSA